MNILVVHNYYQQPGGEDQVFAAEADLLSARGHSVTRHSVHNDQIAEMGRLELAQATLWNRQSHRQLSELLTKTQAGVVHFHNTFPLISPAAYYAAKARGLAVVQTLHNYRLFCANSFFFREGRVCEDCFGKPLPWPGVMHACYRDNRAASGAVAAMLSFHRALGTWQRKVDVFIALTMFARDKFVAGGLPAERVAVKPNFLHPDPGIGTGRGGYALFVGRLSPEKGIKTLLEAWQDTPAMPLKIVGDGPEGPQVKAAAQRQETITWLGRQPRERVLALMKDAAVLIFPSIWYEGFPMTLVEAYGVGLPVIASRLGSMASLVIDGRTGLHFRAGDARDLAAQVETLAANPGRRVQMGQAARAEFEANYTAAHNYTQLMEVYQMALARSRA